LQRPCFYRETEFLHHSSTLELSLFPKHIKGLYPRFNVSQPSGRSSSALWRLCGANSCVVTMEINTSSKAPNDFSGRINRPTPTSYDVTRLCHHVARLCGCVSTHVINRSTGEQGYRRDLQQSEALAGFRINNALQQCNSSLAEQ
jgi:hypothetical protein